MKRIIEFLAVAALGAALLWTLRGRAAGFPYGYDEADYLLTVEKGFLAHWWDSPSLTLPQFVQLGRGGSNRRELSDLVRERGYVDFYRHWHGPLYFYWMMMGDHDCEKCARSVQTVFHIATFLLVYAGVRALAGMPAALLASVAFLISFTNVQTALQLIPHSLFTLCYTAGLLAAAWWMKTGRQWAWYAAVVSAGLAFTTLEVALILMATLAVCAWLEREKLRGQWVRFATRSSAVFLATVLVVWPAGLLKLSFVKAYAFMAYLALFRKAAWGGESVAGSWLQRMANSPVEWALFAVGLALLIAKRRQWPELIPFAVFGVLMIAAVGKVAADDQMFLVPRYQAPYLTALLVLGCIAAVRLFPGARAWAAAGLLLALVSWNSWRQFEANPVPGYFPWKQVVEGLGKQSLEGKTVLVPQGILPVMRYYLRQVNWRPYADDQSLAAEVDQVRPAGYLRVETGGAGAGEVVVLSKSYSGERILFHDLRGAAR